VSTDSALSEPLPLVLAAAGSVKAANAATSERARWAASPEWCALSRQNRLVRITAIFEQVAVW